MITNVFQDGSQAKTLMWQKIGSQADEWKQGLLQLPPSRSSYKVSKQCLDQLGTHSLGTQTCYRLLLGLPLFSAELSDCRKYACFRRVVVFFAMV